MLLCGLVESLHTAHRCIHFTWNISRQTRNRKGPEESGGQHSAHAPEGWPFRQGGVGGFFSVDSLVVQVVKRVPVIWET